MKGKAMVMKSVEPLFAVDKILRLLKRETEGQLTVIKYITQKAWQDGTLETNQTNYLSLSTLELKTKCKAPRHLTTFWGLISRLNLC